MANTNWENLPSTNTPINSTNLNKISNGLVNISNEVDNTYRVNLLESKNLIDLPVLNSSCTKNSDGSITYNNTSGYDVSMYINDNIGYLTGILEAGTYTLNNISGKGMFVMFSASDYSHSVGVGNDYTFTYDGTSFLRIVYQSQATGTSITYKCQLEKGSSATEYQPFMQKSMYVDDMKFTDTLNVGNVVDSRSRVNVLKSKNLLDLSSLTTQTINGITYTKNSDGTITANGTASANASLMLTKINTLSNKTYFLNGCPSGGSNSTYTMYISGSSPAINDFGNGVSFSKEFNGNNLVFIVFSGQTVSNLVIKPMLIEGTSALPYEAYITPSIYVDNEEIYSKMKVYTDTYATYFKFDKMVCCVVNRQAQTTDGTIATIPSEFACANDMRNVINYYNGSSYVSGILWSQNVGLYIRDMYGNVPSNASFIRGMLIWEAKN